MALLPILHFPDPRLRTPAAPVAEITEQVRTLAADMFETMYHAPGIGLAATQVNVPQRVIVVDISRDKDQPLCLVNPEILDKNGEEEMEEGCLSVPGVFETVRRAEKVRVRYLSLDGRETIIDADGLLAVCIQHEVDHLDGRLFVDYLSTLKRNRIRRRLEKSQAEVL
ncbi:MAG: Peptide deformylase 1 [Gammaproteobacteria bacterium]|nr:Peptide deformylase 1 [Gammaproteobacteria bacterium]